MTSPHFSRRCCPGGTATATATAARTPVTETPIESEDDLFARIQGTHAPTNRQVDLSPIVQLIENIFRDAAGSFKARHGISNGAASLDGYDDMTQVLDDIHKISCEMSCNHSGDLERLPVTLLERLCGYQWSAKVVLVVAAFALTFGEFWLITSLRNKNLFANSLDLLRGYPQISDLTALNKFLKAMLDLVKTNFAFLEPRVCDLPEEVNSMKDAMKYFPEATYQIIRCLVSLSSILGKKEDNIEMTISSLEVEVISINVALQEILQRCKKDAENTEEQQYQEVCGILESEEQIKIIAKLTGKNEQEVPESLRNKHVLFFISDLEMISIESINIVKRLKMDSRDYDIIWIPIVDGLTDKQTKFREIESKMTWTVVNPGEIETAVVRYIKTEWHFNRHPIAVSLNGEGKVTCTNALGMLLTWGNSAFPFTEEKEKNLWGKVDERTGWKLDLLVTEQIDRTILSWGQSTETFVCLFGGENLTWIQEFTAKVKEATTAAYVSLKMAYVGKSKGKGLERNKLGADIQVIESEYRLHFWSRLESIFYSKTQLEKSSNDRVIREVLKVLSYDNNGKDWAIFAMGSAVMVTTNGETAEKIMSDYKKWKEDAARYDFLEGLKIYMNNVHPPHGCIHVHLPVLGHIPGPVICPECSQEMEMYYAYRCCA